MPGLLTEKLKCKQILWVTERRGRSGMKYAYDYIQYIPQSCRKEKTMSINHTTIISINYTTTVLPLLIVTFIVKHFFFQSLHRRGQVLSVPWGWGSQISWQLAHEGGKFCQFNAPAAFIPPGNTHVTNFS